MKLKNAFNSEECKDLRNLISQVNGIISRINRIAEDEDELHTVNAHMAAAQRILCKKLGEALYTTLSCAQDIEADEKQEVTFLSRSKDAPDHEWAEPPTADSADVTDGPSTDGTADSQ